MKQSPRSGPEHVCVCVWGGMGRWRRGRRWDEGGGGGAGGVYSPPNYIAVI